MGVGVCNSWDTSVSLLKNYRYFISRQEPNVIVNVFFSNMMVWLNISSENNGITPKDYKRYSSIA
jgi:hypothetical protein